MSQPTQPAPSGSAPSPPARPQPKAPVVAPPRVIRVQPPAPRTVPLDGFANAGHEWLTYETIFNHRPFRRTNQERAMGIYRVRLDALRVVVAAGLPDATLELLRSAFFPDVADIATLRTCLDRPWDPAYQPATVRAAKAKGGQAALPFNFRDNDSATLSMGAASVTRHRTAAPALPRNDVRRLHATWPMWSTASRSCVVRLDPVPKPWPDDPATAAEPDRVGLLAGEILAWPFGAGEALPEGRGDIEGPSALGSAAVGAPGSRHFSVKCGVTYVGGSAQGSASAGNKAKLEANSILACLRSDHIAAVDRTHRAAPQAGVDPLVVLPEVLTVTEDLGDEPGDGFQVRDLSRLRRDMRYFPALSIPYVGAGAGAAAVDFDTFGPRWRGVEDNDWIRFWSAHFAAPLGVAKAELLLRYGLQLATPNPQNFLLEFAADMTPTGRVVLRDLGDALLHTEVIWSMFGADPAPAKSLKDTRFAQPQPVLEYERTTLAAHGHYPAETGGDRGGNDSYPAGTQFSWHYYSALSKGSTVATPSITSTDPDAQDPATWREALTVNSIWGDAHNEAYAAHLERALGITIGAVTVPANHTRYMDLSVRDYAAAEPLWRADVDGERTAAARMHAALTAPAGLAALRRYQAARVR